MKRSLSLSALALVLLTTIANGQSGVPATQVTPDNDTGVRPNQTYAGAHEDIGLANGNLSLEIPLAGFPGRNGLNYKLALQYDSKIWSPHTSYSNSGADLTFDWRYEQRTYAVGQLGWRFNIPAVTPGDWITDSNGVFIGQTPYVIELQTGAKASVAYGSGTIDSEDGSFVSFNGNNDSGVVTEKDGTKMSFGTGGGVGTVQDTNGNYINFQGPITDTLGRQITFTDGATTATVSYKDTTGTTQNITLTYTWLTLFNSTDPNSQYYTGTTRFASPAQNSASNQGHPRYLWVHKPANDQPYKLLTRIDFPDHTFYTFSYNGYGELIKITYPTGGYTKYTYAAFQHGAIDWDVFDGDVEFGEGNIASDFREITSKSVCRSANGICATEDLTTYVPSIASPFVNNSEVDIINPLGEKTSISFTNDTDDDVSLSLHSPKEISRNVYDSGGTLLKTVTTEYLPLDSPLATFSTLPSRVTTTLYDVSPPLVTKTETSYDTYSAYVRWPPSLPYQQQSFQYRTRYIDNPISETIYDFGTSAPGAALRTTTTTWWKSLWTQHIWNRPLTSDVTGAGGNHSSTAFEYDNYTEAITATGATQHDSAYGTAYTARGNQTAVSHWRNTDGASLTTRHQYDDAGNVTKTTDPGGHATSFAYSSIFQSAYPTQVTMPTTAGVAHVTHTNYDFNTGLKTSDTDQNGNITSYSYDAMLRPTEIDLPQDPNQTGHGQTNFTYPDANTLLKSVKLTSSSSTYSYSHTDGLGRMIETQSCEDGTSACTRPINTDTAYDAVGRVYTVSNPYRPADTVYQTTTTYDPLGRSQYTYKQDGSYSVIAYSGNVSTACDEANRCRTFYNDALGRLSHVIEPTPDNSAWAYNTYYSYDALNNLLAVNQQGDGTGTARNRSFTYNSLSQLLTATNPESGQLTYTYDNDGSVLTKTDARGKVTTNSYDQLNRVLSTTYSNSTPPKTYVYDTSNWGVTSLNPVGRLTLEYTANTWNLFSFDTMGRVQTQWSTEAGSGGSYITTAAYDLAGDLASLTYPSGRTVVQEYDTAGRLNLVNLASFNGTAVNYNYLSVPATYNGQPGFFASGSPQYGIYGSGLVESFGLNSRLQPCQYQLQSGSTFFVDRRNYFGNAANYCQNSGVSGNNGNVISATDNVWDAAHTTDGQASARSQYFTYDYLNRIKTASEGPAGQSNVGRWGQDFTNGIDPWGNLHGIAVTKGTAQPWNVNIDANNRLQGFGYDASGNLTMDTGHTYIYDAESQLTGIDSNATMYLYDPSGQRVRKMNSAYQPVTEYVYFGGEPIAEKNQAGDWSDYVFANGKRIAKADNFENSLALFGTNCSNCGYQDTIASFPNAGGYNGYVIRAGDVLRLRQLQATGSRGGIMLGFSDGTCANWLVSDQDGELINSDTHVGAWHYRTINLGQFAGKTLSSFSLVMDVLTQGGNWQLYVADMVITNPDGTVMTFYNDSPTSPGLSLSYSSGVSNVSSFINHRTGDVGPVPYWSTTYYHGDHLGSEQMITSAGGWPVWQDTYMPYGTEVGTVVGTNHYKFTGKERDAETQNDYFGARFYNSRSGRWLTPDWSAAPEPIPYADMSDPQSLNLYGYVRNRPTFSVDEDGHGADSPLEQDPQGSIPKPISGKQFVANAQAGLNIASLIPGPVGRGAALLNAGISFLRGDVKDGALSAAAAIPGGSLGKLGKAEQLVANAEKGVVYEKGALEAEGLVKNTKAVTAVDSKTGKLGTTIPDSLPGGKTVEAKNVQYLSDSKQLRLQSAASTPEKAQVLVPSTTKVSKTVVQRMEVKVVDVQK